MPLTRRAHGDSHPSRVSTTAAAAKTLPPSRSSQESPSYIISSPKFSEYEGQLQHDSTYLVGARNRGGSESAQSSGLEGWEALSLSSFRAHVTSPDFMKRSARRFIFGVLTTGMFFAGYVYYMTTVAPELEKEHADLSCELEAEDSIFREPNNFWTNLAFVFAALWIFLWIDSLESRARSSTQTSSEIRSTTQFYSTLYGAMVLVVGFGSHLLHGMLTDFGSWADNAAIVWFAWFIIGYEILSLVAEPTSKDGTSHRTKALFVTLLLVACATSGSMTWADSVLRRQTTKVVLGSAVALLPTVSFIRSNMRSQVGLTVGEFASAPSQHFLWLGTGSMAVAFTFWIFDRTQIVPCPDTHVYQHHGMWHIGCAIGTVFLYYHLFVLRDEHPQGFNNSNRNRSTKSS